MFNQARKMGDRLTQLQEAVDPGLTPSPMRSNCAELTLRPSFSSSPSNLSSSAITMLSVITTRQSLGQSDEDHRRIESGPTKKKVRILSAPAVVQLDVAEEARISRDLPSEVFQAGQIELARATLL